MIGERAKGRMEDRVEELIEYKEVNKGRWFGVNSIERLAN